MSSFDYCLDLDEDKFFGETNLSGLPQILLDLIENCFETGFDDLVDFVGKRVILNDLGAYSTKKTNLEIARAYKLPNNTVDNIEALAQKRLLSIPEFNELNELNHYF